MKNKRAFPRNSTISGNAQAKFYPRGIACACGVSRNHVCTRGAADLSTRGEGEREIEKEGYNTQKKRKRGHDSYSSFEEYSLLC